MMNPLLNISPASKEQTSSAGAASAKTGKSEAKSGVFASLMHALKKHVPHAAAQEGSAQKTTVVLKPAHHAASTLLQAPNAGVAQKANHQVQQALGQDALQAQGVVGLSAMGVKAEKVSLDGKHITLDQTSSINTSNLLAVHLQVAQAIEGVSLQSGRVVATQTKNIAMKVQAQGDVSLAKSSLVQGTTSKVQTQDDANFAKPSLVQGEASKVQIQGDASLAKASLVQGEASKVQTQDDATLAKASLAQGAASKVQTPGDASLAKASLAQSELSKVQPQGDVNLVEASLIQGATSKVQTQGDANLAKASLVQGELSKVQAQGETLKIPTQGDANLVKASSVQGEASKVQPQGDATLAKASLVQGEALKVQTQGGATLAKSSLVQGSKAKVQTEDVSMVAKHTLPQDVVVKSQVQSERSALQKTASLETEVGQKAVVSNPTLSSHQSTGKAPSLPNLVNQTANQNTPQIQNMQQPTALAAAQSEDEAFLSQAASLGVMDGKSSRESSGKSVAPQLGVLSKDGNAIASQQPTAVSWLTDVKRTGEKTSKHGDERGTTSPLGTMLDASSTKDARPIQQQFAANMAYRTAQAFMPQAVMSEVARAAKDGIRKLELQLEPASLGKIQVSLQMDAAKHLQVHILVDQSQSKQLLDQQLPQLRQALADQGLNLSGFSMDMNSRQGREQQGGASFSNQGQHTVASLEPLEQTTKTGQPMMGVNTSAVGGINILA